ncbi:MAG: hypothetical protein IPP33_11850 [Flavobacteriales bacterium]|nr:hypothetical protein [Flavobacteriales bacterium]
MSLPSVLLLGSGRIAYHLGHAFKRVGVPLVGIVGRNEETVKELSVALDTRSFSLSKGLPESSAVVICVSDQAIAEVAKLLPARNSAIITPAVQVPWTVCCPMRTARHYGLS